MKVRANKIFSLGSLFGSPAAAIDASIVVRLVAAVTCGKTLRLTQRYAVKIFGRQINLVSTIKRLPYIWFMTKIALLFLENHRQTKRFCLRQTNPKSSIYFLRFSSSFPLSRSGVRRMKQNSLLIRNR